MIDRLLEEIMRQLKDVDRDISSSHLPPMTVRAIEEELMIGGTYSKAIPEGFPDGTVEQKGFRRLSEPANGRYQNMLLRVGKTKLHLKENGADKTLESVAMLYMGNSERINLGMGEKGPSAVTATEMAYAMVHENGVVSGGYLRIDSPAIIVVSWCPREKARYGGHFYPQDAQEVFGKMYFPLTRVGLEPTPTFEVVPRLVMLGIETSKSIR